MSATNPIVTVILCTYQRPHYLGDAIRSVTLQDFQEWELLVINDGGPDVSQLVAGFADPRIRYLPQEKNRGKAVCCNIGLKEARGRYIAYIDDDDMWYPNHLGVLTKALDENPEAGAAYSDLYAVSFIKDEATGRRYILDKRMSVSRDFCRPFMFYFNHTLHVSLMHRKDAALRVGGYNETVTSLIDWNITRKLVFLYDFVHVQIPTGEYYMPLFKSDRISIVQRKDKKKFKQNSRIIKADFPPEPWTRVDRVDVIFPVEQWDDELKNKLCDLIDEICHPIRIILVNNGTGLSPARCRKTLGELAELSNIRIINSKQKIEDIFAFRLAAGQSDADYLLLATMKLQPKAVQKRVMAGLDFLKRVRQSEGVKWDVPEETESNFEFLINRELFLRKSDPGYADQAVNLNKLPQVLPEGFQFDLVMAEARRQFSKGKYSEALQSMRQARKFNNGTPTKAFSFDFYTRICLALKQYGEAEKECQALARAGYRPDNLIRLGEILQAQGRHKEAVQAYQEGFQALGMTENDLDSSVFPIDFPRELNGFTALIGLGESHLELGDQAEAARMFRRASRLRANSHRPFLGFAKLFLATNQLDQAETALGNAGMRDGRDPETHRLLGKLCERRKRLDLAFTCYLKAFANAKDDEKNLDPLYFTGANLGKWAELKPVFQEFLEHRPGHVQAVTKLTAIHLNLGEVDQAAEICQSALNRNPAYAPLKAMARKIEQAQAEKKPAPAEAEPKSEEPDEGLTEADRKSPLYRLLRRTVPEPLMARAYRNTYAQACPYPLESMLAGFAAEKFITRETPIIAIGSCFAQHLSEWLQGHGYNCLPHPWGVIYNPQNLRQFVQQAFEPETWNPVEPYWIMKGQYCDPYRKDDSHTGPYPLGASEEEASARLAEYRQTSRSIFEKAGLAVFTLGLTELWRNKADHKAYFRMPYPHHYDEQLHEFHDLSFSEVVESLRWSIETLTSHNPGLKVLLSVSPIPLHITFRDHLGPYIATQFSKSTLHAAVLEIINTMDNVHYMPSYEIVRNDPGAHYLPDGRHVRPETVELIMNVFKDLYVK